MSPYRLSHIGTPKKSWNFLLVVQTGDSQALTKAYEETDEETHVETD
jgi:hypothetical protein